MNVWKAKLPPWTADVADVKGQRGTAPFGVAKSATQFTSMLTEAVRQGRPTSYIDSLIRAGGDPNVQHATTGLSAVHTAAKFGMVEHIVFLADSHGADVNAQSKTSGATPLISKEALRYLHHEVLDDDSPVQVNTNDESGSVNVHASTILGGGAAISMAKGAAGIGVAAAGGAALMEY